jgi:hypothetical protein
MVSALDPVVAPINEIISEDEYYELKDAVEAPWNNPEFVETRITLEQEYESCRAAQDPLDPDRLVYPLVEDLRSWLNFIEHEIVVVHGDSNYYDDLDNGVLRNVLNLARSFLEEMEINPVYTWDHVNSLTVFDENSYLLFDELDSHFSTYFQSNISKAQLNELEKYCDYYEGQNEIHKLAI